MKGKHLKHLGVSEKLNYIWYPCEVDEQCENEGHAHESRGM